jgi:hypothetical protein
MTYYFEALPYGSESRVELKIGMSEERESLSIPDRLREVYERTRSERADVPWISTFIATTNLDIWDQAPATRLAHQWVKDDFGKLPWMAGHV